MLVDTMHAVHPYSSHAVYTCQLLLKVLHTATFTCTKEINSNAFRYLVYKLQVESLMITDRLIQKN